MTNDVVNRSELEAHAREYIDKVRRLPGDQRGVSTTQISPEEVERAVQETTDATAQFLKARHIKIIVD